MSSHYSILPCFLEVFLLKPSELSQTFIISPPSPEKERDERQVGSSLISFLWGGALC
jgi:hypothetical protein